MDINNFAIKILSGFNPDKIDTIYFDILCDLLKCGLSNQNEIAKIILQKYRAYNVFKMLISNGANNINELAILAATYLKYKELILCIDNGAKNLDEIAKVILSNDILNKIEISQALIRNGINLDNLAFYAATLNNIEILTLIDNINVNNIVLIAAENCYTNIFMKFIDKYTGNINQLAYLSSKNIFCDKIVFKCIELGANNFNEIAYNAAETGNIRLVKIAIEHGADDIITIGLIASSNGNLSVVSYILENYYNCKEHMLRVAKEKRIIEFLESIT